MQGFWNSVLGIMPVNPWRASTTEAPTTQNVAARPQIGTNMGFIAFIKKEVGALETFAGKAEKELQKLWGEAPKFDDVALTTISFAAPLLETAFALEFGPAGETEVTKVITIAQRDLIAAKGVITAVGPTLSAKNLLDGVQSDLKDATTLTDVKSPKTVSIIQTVLGELSALVAAFPVVTATPVAPAATTAAPAVTAAEPATVPAAG